MGIKDVIEGKKEWRAHLARVKDLPKDYQIVYKEIQKYLFKVGPVELTEGIGLLSGIIDLFEEGVALEKDVLEVTGSDVAAFCDDLIKDSKTSADVYQERESDRSNLLENIERLHTTELGIKRIKKNLSIDVDDIVKWCKDKIQQPNASILRKGKNWYVKVDGCEITVNATSLTIITAHKKRNI